MEDKTFLAHLQSYRPSLTFLRAVGRLTLGISLSFPLLTRGAVESREL